ncbi:MAG: lysophospholipid acyltransferase family protein [Chlorobi bacterium]|nr:lysophospholipid acyltransferase family protein [Chlorobiota bacterium]
MKIRNFFLKILLAAFASLPFGALYLVSDFLTFVNLHIIRYRRKIIKNNLTKCFPGKNEKEIKKIIRKFYRNLSDLIVELAKSGKMTREQIEKHVVFKNQHVLDDLYDEKKNVFALLGHCGNWEWVGNKIALFLRHEGAAIYKPLADKFFDEYMVQQRQKYKGTLMIDYKKVFRTLVTLKDKLITVFVLADQSPPRTEMNYFLNFFGNKTAFYDGTEKVARALNYAVVYLDVSRVKRGYYEVEIKTITKNAADTEPGFITSEYVRLLENTINDQPDNWLWSHRRWKTKEEKQN